MSLCNKSCQTHIVYYRLLSRPKQKKNPAAHSLTHHAALISLSISNQSRAPFILFSRHHLRKLTSGAVNLTLPLKRRQKQQQKPTLPNRFLNSIDLPSYSRRDKCAYFSGILLHFRSRLSSSSSSFSSLSSSWWRLSRSIRSRLDMFAAADRHKLGNWLK